MWFKGDLDGFNSHVQHKIGQINVENTTLGKYIYSLAKDPENKVFFEIGTWNGLGSTRCIAIGMLENTEKTELHSLETNVEKYEFAKKIWQNTAPQLDLRFYNGSLISREEMEAYVQNINLTDEEKFFYKIDYENLQTVLSKDIIPAKIDVLVLDGSDFSSGPEFDLLYPRSKYIVLDDINVLKNKRNHRLLKENNQYNLIVENLTERNGYSIFKRI